MLMNSKGLVVEVAMKVRLKNYFIRITYLIVRVLEEWVEQVMEGMEVLED